MSSNDKRTNPRRAVQYPAMIEFDDGTTPARSCTLRDASEGGAQIVVSEPAGIPEEFTLVLGYDHSARRRCVVQWRSDAAIGVRFTAMPRFIRRSAPPAAPKAVTAGSPEPKKAR